jgi:hypothetical protein
MHDQDASDAISLAWFAQRQFQAFLAGLASGQSDFASASRADLGLDRLIACLKKMGGIAPGQCVGASAPPLN